MRSKTLCHVCGKVVGAWHKTGVHPKCAGKDELFSTPGSRTTSIFHPKAQAQRDAILRQINGAPRERR